MLLCNQSEIPVTFFYNDIEKVPFLSHSSRRKPSLQSMVPATSWEMNSFSPFYFLLLAYLHQSGKRSPSTSPYLIHPFFYHQTKLLLKSYGLNSFSFCGPKRRSELSSELRAIESVFLRLSWEHIFLRYILIIPRKFIPHLGTEGGGGDRWKR